MLNRRLLGLHAAVPPVTVPGSRVRTGRECTLAHSYRHPEEMCKNEVKRLSKRLENHDEGDALSTF